MNLSTKKKTKLSGLPEVKVTGQGGLLDIKVHPGFSKNRWIFFTYAAEWEKGWTTHLARAEINGNKLENLKMLFRALPANRAGQHFGSRIVIDSDDFVFVTVGERGERDWAQDLSKHPGKVIRIRTDGSVPKDNPFVGKKDARPEIWSYGHRNPQGMDIHPTTGEIWIHEHGPRGGDEINIVRKGLNYGWPIATYGKEYYGPSIAPPKKKGVENPIHHWTPSIAPSGLRIYNSDRIPQWKGSLLSGSLVLTHLNRIELNEKKKMKIEERLFEKEDWRVRAVVISPEGDVLFSTDDGTIRKISPVEKKD